MDPFEMTLSLLTTIMKRILLKFILFYFPPSPTPVLLDCRKEIQFSFEAAVGIWATGLNVPSFLSI
jgi:hypothetical protein